MMFSELAEVLYEEGKHDKAIEVLDYAEEMLPGYNVSYDYTSASMAALYYTLGEMEKGSAIMNQVAANAVEYLEWGSSLEPASRKATQSTIGHYSAVLGFVLNNLQRFEQKELFNKYFELYSQYASVR
jgi:tetratricopeptide (TPR) repeat protein